MEVGSKYLNRLQNAAEKCPKDFELSSSALLVERIKVDFVEKKIAGSDKTIIIPTKGNSKFQNTALEMSMPDWAIVLLCNQDVLDEDGVQLYDTNPGDIILLGSHSVKWFGVFGALDRYEADSIGLTRQSEIQARFGGRRSFDKFFQAANEQ